MQGVILYNKGYIEVRPVQLFNYYVNRSGFHSDEGDRAGRTLRYGSFTRGQNTEVEQ